MRYKKILITILLILTWQVGDLTVGVFSVQDLSVIAYDVGQGDAIYLRTPAGHDIIIDGGPSDDFANQLAKNLKGVDRKIELMILTHPDADHLQGLLGVLDNYQVEKVLVSEHTKQGELVDKWQAALEQEGVEIVIAQRGMRILSGGTKIEILSPPTNFELADSANNRSIVLSVKYGENRMLFMGDAEKEIEDYLVSKKTYLKADVLKIGHHGSNSSTKQSLVNAVAPQVAIISVGADNSYGHPHAETLSILKETEILRTDQIGNVLLVSNGREISR